MTKICGVCGSNMHPGHAWWWTKEGAVCSEVCARLLEQRKTS